MSKNHCHYYETIACTIYDSTLLTKTLNIYKSKTSRPTISIVVYRTIPKNVLFQNIKLKTCF